MWECDGCGLTAPTMEECEQHIIDNYVPDRPVWEVKCWGVMLVGSNVWLDHKAGIHPMTSFIQNIVVPAYRAQFN